MSKVQNVIDYNRESFILVVDDDNTLLKFFKIHLNKFYSKVIVVETAKEALATIKEKNVDLVLSDIRMPKVDGIELMGKIKKYDMTIPVVLVSGAMLDEAQTQASAAADGFLRKPFGVDDLHSMIERNLGRRQQMIKLSEFCKSAKSFRELVAGALNVESAVKKQFVADAEKIMLEMKKSA